MPTYSSALLVYKHDAQMKGTTKLAQIRANFQLGAALFASSAIAIFNEKLHTEILGRKTSAMAEIKCDIRSALTSCFFFSRIIVNSGSEA